MLYEVITFRLYCPALRHRNRRRKILYHNEIYGVYPVTSSGNSQSGFTLIEAVITMTLATILGAMMYSYFSEALMRSAEPVHNLQKAFDLHAAMENITADYYDIISAGVVPNTWEPSTGYLPGDQVVSKSQKFGHIYTCITGGTSGATENWSTDTGMSYNFV